MSQNNSFPLDRPLNCVGLERDVYDDTEESYRIFCRVPENSVNLDHFKVDDIKEIARDVRKQREELESALLMQINEGDSSAAHRLAKLSARADIATSLDLLRFVFDGSNVVLHNRYMDVESPSKLRCKSVDWAILCVLEDKLQRILAFHSDEDAHSLLAELECIREWHPAQYPRWLAFEVEQCLCDSS